MYHNMASTLQQQLSMPTQANMSPVHPGAGTNPQQQSQSQEHKLDNISKVKALIWPLKDSLANTMKIAAQNVYQNATIDTGIKSNDSSIPRFDKSLEEFYSLCDQIELNLKTALECATLTSSSQRYTPIPIAKADGGPDNLGYSQYLNTVRTQVAYAKEIHDALSSAARNITSTE